MKGKERFHLLGELIYHAYQEGDYEAVRVLAHEYLNLAAQNKNDWNYGNAIHQANTYLGLLALKSNKIENAKNFLIEAALTPGSPQLSSFGPNMLLAKKLLELGERKVVLEYVDMTKYFWSFFPRLLPTRKWKKMILNNRIPNFGAHLTYHMHYPNS